MFYEQTRRGPVHRRSPMRKNTPSSPITPAEPSASFQCLLASAMQQVDKVAAAETAAEQAALSLGQRERIAALAAEARALRTTLAEAADARARVLLAPQTSWMGRIKAHVAPRLNAPAAGALSWEPAVREARHVVADAADCLRTLGASLPAGGAAARMAAEVDGLLRRHRIALGDEMARWAT